MFMEIISKINGQPLQKLNYFSSSDIDATISLIIISIFLNSFLHDLIISVGFGTDNAAPTPKKVWKRNIDEIYDFKPNPIMQCRNYTLTRSALISTSMTMQLANSGILTVWSAFFPFNVCSLHRTAHMRL